MNTYTQYSTEGMFYYKATRASSLHTEGNEEYIPPVSITYTVCPFLQSSLVHSSPDGGRPKGGGKTEIPCSLCWSWSIYTHIKKRQLPRLHAHHLPLQETKSRASTTIRARDSSVRPGPAPSSHDRQAQAAPWMKLHVSFHRLSSCRHRDQVRAAGPWW